MNQSKPLYVFLLSFLFFPGLIFGQKTSLKKPVHADEIFYLKSIIAQMSESDQRYRNYIANGTLDDNIIKEMDAVYDAKGIEAYMKYRKSLNLSLDPALKDSLWQLQHNLDIANHLTLRGILETYGFLPEEILEEDQNVPLLILMHPPKDWVPAAYLEEYSAILIPEVNAGRMPAKTFATFYDNIKTKIMREPQLYGTGKNFDIKTNTVLPPFIEDLHKSNQARQAIGLPILNEGEYRLMGDK